jgi:transcriptional regulator with XRE-family HTH domain
MEQDYGVGREVKRLRESRRWSQSRLAVEAKMSVSGVSMIENGHRNLSTATLAKLAEALGVEVGDLFPKGQAPLPEMQDYGVLLEEKGFPREQIAAWLAAEEHDKEFIARELEKMSEQDFREALIATNPTLRKYYRENDPRTDASPQSRSA